MADDRQGERNPIRLLLFTLSGLTLFEIGDAGTFLISFVYRVLVFGTMLAIFGVIRGASPPISRGKRRSHSSTVAGEDTGGGPP